MRIALVEGGTSNVWIKVSTFFARNCAWFNCSTVRLANGDG
jgi:hypothetical protein